MEKRLSLVGHDHSRNKVIAPTLLNSWVNYDPANWQPAAYFKDSHGVVHLRGLIKSGSTTPGTAIFQLPAGYRPLVSELFSVSSFDNGTSSYVIGRVDVTSSGTVQFVVGSNGFISLNGISFLAGQ